MTQDNNSLPGDAAGLASWFAEGVRSELSALEKDGSTQSYELLSGKLTQAVSATKAIYHFIIADGTRIPEDATGKLKTSSEEYAASVTGQQTNRIDVCMLDGVGPRQVIDFMSQGWEKRADLGLRVPVWGFKLP